MAGDPAQALYDDVCFCADDLGRLITLENEQRDKVTSSPAQATDCTWPRLLTQPPASCGCADLCSPAASAVACVCALQPAVARHCAPRLPGVAATAAACPRCAICVSSKLCVWLLQALATGTLPEAWEPTKQAEGGKPTLHTTLRNSYRCHAGIVAANRLLPMQMRSLCPGVGPGRLECGLHSVSQNSTAVGCPAVLHMPCTTASVISWSSRWLAGWAW